MTINKNLFIFILSIAIVGSVMTGLLIHSNNILDAETAAKSKEVDNLQSEKTAFQVNKKLLETEIKKFSIYNFRELI